MNGIEAGDFAAKVRRDIRSESDMTQYLKENCFFRTLKVLVKAKTEVFQGQNRLRFYALDVVREDQREGVILKEEN